MFFSIVMEGLDFITLYVALSTGQVDSILGGHPKGLVSGPARRVQSNAVMILLSGSASTFVVVKVVKYLYSHTRTL